MPRGPGGWHLLAVLAVIAGAAVRLVWGLWLHPGSHFVYSDMSGYVTRAVAVVHGTFMGPDGGVYPPGTHLLLAAPFAAFGTGSAGLWAADVLWCLMAALVPLLAWLFIRELVGERAGALTAVGCAAWPPFVSFAGYFTSETPATMLLLLALWLLLRLRHAGVPSGRTYLLAATAGAAAVATVAVRPQLSLNLVVALIPLLSLWRRALLVTAAAAGAGLPLAAVLFLGQQLSGQPSLGANGGVNFFQGHCAVHAVLAGPADDVMEVLSPIAVQQHLGLDYTFRLHRMTDQPFFYQQGWHCITADPAHQATLALHHLADLTATTRMWPQVDDSGAFAHAVHTTNLVWAFVLPLTMVAALAGWRWTETRRRDAHVELLAHLLCAAVLAVVYYGDPRFRVPYDVFGLALLASLISRLPAHRAAASAAAVGPAPATATAAAPTPVPAPP